MGFSLYSIRSSARQFFEGTKDQVGGWTRDFEANEREVVTRLPSRTAETIGRRCW